MAETSEQPVLIKCPICGSDGGPDGFAPGDKCCSDCDTSEVIPLSEDSK
jgi:hypothetical protein